ncbi:MAG: hypothetical protein IJ909_09145 [Fibrobacter sp.]|nr:hypothetical protein [Fibrobacter sp.]
MNASPVFRSSAAMVRRESLISGWASASYSSCMAFLKCGGIALFHSVTTVEKTLDNESIRAL